MSAVDKMSIVELTTIWICWRCRACASVLCNSAYTALSTVAGSAHINTLTALPWMCVCTPPHASRGALLSISSLGRKSSSCIDDVRMFGTNALQQKIVSGAHPGTVINSHAIPRSGRCPEDICACVASACFVSPSPQYVCMDVCMDVPSIFCALLFDCGRRS